MIDFIEATQCLCKDNPNLVHCKPFPCRLNQYGWETYTLQGCKELEVLWKPESGILKVRGSLPYYLQGHNFSYSRKEYVESLDLIQDQLGVGLWDAEVSAFEFGCIFQVEGKPANYISNHSSRPEAHLTQNEKGRDNGTFRWWEDKARSKSLKLYDAGKNIKMKQGMKAREAIEQSGYNPDKRYMKFEIHYNKPHLLNAGRMIIVEDLQTQEWYNTLSSTLIDNYHLLQPMKTLIQPTDKKDYSALDIAVSVLVEKSIDYGIPIEQVKKMVYNKINGAECLDKQDKDARKATFRKAFGKLQEAPESQWDLSDKIEDALTVEMEPKMNN